MTIAFNVRHIDRRRRLLLKDDTGRTIEERWRHSAEGCRGLKAALQLLLLLPYELLLLLLLIYVIRRFDRMLAMHAYRSV